MTGNEIRKKYLDFMAKNGHAVIPSSALVPENDPTTLFTGSGMQPLVPYLMGEVHPKGVRLTDSQKCFRAEDIEEVGDNRHTTFFEMLGNWSLGDYFKDEQIPWMYSFLIDEVGLDPERFYVTAYIGNKEVPKDTKSADIWKKLFEEKGVSSGDAEMGSEEDGAMRGMKENERIFYYDGSKNWWSRAGKPENMPIGEIGGPDTEMFYDFGTEHNPKYGENCHPNCDCGRFIEIGNNVFIEYIKTENGFEKLPKQNVDFGGGLERIAAAANNDADVFKVDLLWAVIEQIEDLSGKSYEAHQEAFRVITDHIRGAVFMIGDGVLPSNSEQGYFVRRLLRRAVRFADKLEIPAGEMKNLAESTINKYESHYRNLEEKKDEIMSAIEIEENQFRKTLENGLKQFNKIELQVHITKQELEEAKQTGKIEGTKAKRSISAQNAFELFTTYGFPIELTEEIAEEKGLIVDKAGFEKLMEEHRAKSRAGAEQKFKGGLADHSDKVIQYHTTHHLLLKALQTVLGDHVKQRGSNITGERLRIDFLHDEKMTDEQKAEVEKIVNEKITGELPVTKSIIPKEEAEKLGAQQEFGAKYPDMVSVYSVGPKDATEKNPQFEKAFSIEFCGGPHVSNTSEIKGVFKIKKEESSSAGVRRIKGILVE